jgi:hypothetical protein
MPEITKATIAAAAVAARAVMIQHNFSKPPMTAPSP